VSGRRLGRACGLPSNVLEMLEQYEAALERSSDVQPEAVELAEALRLWVRERKQGRAHALECDMGLDCSCGAGH
jgi:hypothetical protein